MSNSFDNTKSIRNSPVCSSDFSLLESRTTNFVYISKIVKSWAIGLDIAVQLKSKGNRVIVLDGTHTNFLFRPPSIKRVIFLRRILKNRNIKRVRISVTVGVFDFIHIFMKTKKLIDTKFRENEDEKHLAYTYIAHKSGTSRVDIDDFNKFNLFIAVFKILLLQKKIRSVLAKFSPFNSSVYVFNGREISDSPVLLEAKRLGYATRISERAASSDKFEIYLQSPHTNQEWWDKILIFERHIKEHKIEVNMAASTDYTLNKMNGYDPFESRKWAHLMSNKVTEVRSSGEEYVCYFSVSTGEYSPFPEFESLGGYKDQFTALQDLTEICENLGIKLVIRRHPNSLGMDGVDREKILWKPYLKSKNVEYYSPRSRLSSYELARSSKACFTWRSTIGFDTLAWNIPTFALGPAKWAIEEHVRAWDYDKLKSILRNPISYSQTPNQRREIVERYALYMTHFGNPLTVFSQVERWGAVTKDSKKIRGYLLQPIVGLPSR